MKKLKTLLHENNAYWTPYKTGKVYSGNAKVIAKKCIKGWNAEAEPAAKITSSKEVGRLVDFIQGYLDEENEIHAGVVEAWIFQN